MIKSAASAFITFLLSLLLLPAVASAYMNNVEMALTSGSGTFESPTVLDVDISSGGWEVGYIRYFNDIATDSSPYGAREFLQHPSMVGVAIEGSGVTFEDNDSAAEMTMGEVNVSLGGIYYIDNGDRDTGLGITLASRGEGSESSGATFGGTSDTETSGSSISLFVNQYLTGNMGIALNIESGSYTWEDNLSTASSEYDESALTISAMALIDNKIQLHMSLMSGEADYELGEDEDFKGLTLMAGYYLDQKTGVFIGLHSETTEMQLGDKEELSMFQVSGDFYFNEKTHLMASLANMKNEMSGSSVAEMKVSLIRLNLGFFF